MKGIILAGGHSSRLYPATKHISKQLLPIYDKPMIYYPLSTLMLAGITEFLIITNPHEATLFKSFLRDGSQWGIDISYTTQKKPEGIAQALLLAEDFIANEKVALILGDNVLYGEGLENILHHAATAPQGASIFGYAVSEPQRYGIIQYDPSGKAIDIIEKPPQPISNYAVIGIYFYESNVVEVAKTLKPSMRGELEISDVNRHYLKANNIHIVKLGRGIAWFDTGTAKSLLDAANFIYLLEQRQGLKIGSPEEVAWRKGLIDTNQLANLAIQVKSDYSHYLLSLLNT